MIHYLLFSEKIAQKNHFGIKWNEIFARKIQPKHETQIRFSDETQNLIHYSFFPKKSAQDFSFQNYSKPKTLREKFSQNMKRKDVFQIFIFL